MSYHWYFKYEEKGPGVEEVQALFCLETGTEIFIQKEAEDRFSIRMEKGEQTHTLFRGSFEEVDKEFDELVANLQSIN